MQFSFARAFYRSLRTFNPRDKTEIQRQVDAFMLAMDARQIPSGLGIKKLQREVWEFRLGLRLRVLFQWHKDRVTLLFIGNHNEVQQFLKHFLS